MIEMSKLSKDIIERNFLGWKKFLDLIIEATLECS